MANCAITRTTCWLIVGLVAVTCAQKLRTGSCPTLSSSPSPTLLFTNLPDTWMVTAWSPSIHRIEWKCLTYTFTTITANVQYSIAISGRHKLLGTVNSAGLLTITGGDGADSTTGTVLTFSFTEGGKTMKWDYYIAYTNNINYISLYACENFLLGKIESALILTLSGTTDSQLTNAINSLAKFGVSRSDLAYPFSAECL